MDLEKVKARKGEYADYMAEKIKGVISDCGTRFSGSDGEKEAAYYLEKELKNYSDETKVESFEVHPNSFYGWAPWTVTFLLLGVACLFLMPFLSIVFVILALVPMLTTFVTYRTAFDRFYPKKESHNVTAVKMPKGEVKRAVYFSGHMDAAKEWTINYKFGGKVMTAAVLIGFLSIVYITAVAIYSMIVLPKAGVTFSGIFQRTYGRRKRVDDKLQIRRKSYDGGSFNRLFVYRLHNRSCDLQYDCFAESRRNV